MDLWTPDAGSTPAAITMAINRSQNRNATILRDLADGYQPEAIARMRSEDEEYVTAVLRAYRSARLLLSAGAEPRVVYANFCDLLTKKACGL